MQNQNKYQIHLSLLEKVQKEENYKNNNKNYKKNIIKLINNKYKEKILL